MTSSTKTRFLIRRGTRALQPLATDVYEGTLYFVTDELLIERSNGIVWQGYSPSVGGSVPGTNQQVIFNDGGVLAGDIAFLFNKTTNSLTLGGEWISTGGGASLRKSTDDSAAIIAGGSAPSSSNGAQLLAWGNTSALPGSIWAALGNVTGAAFSVIQGSGAVAVTVDGTTGNVGIGTSTPANLAFNPTSKTLHVKDITNGAVVRMEGTTANFEFGCGLNANLWVTTNSKLQFATNNLQRMTIIENGNVVIGASTNPDPLGWGVSGGKLLGIIGDSGLPATIELVGTSITGTNKVAQITIGHMPSAYYANIAAYRDGADNAIGFFYQVSNAGSVMEAMRVSSIGNVGIGTGGVNPTDKLEVVGNIRLTGAVSEQRIRFRPGGTQQAIMGLSGSIKADSSTDMAFFGETGNGVVFMVNGSPTDAMRLTSGGSLALGLSVPLARFHIKGTVDTNDAAFRLENPSAGGTTWQFTSALDGQFRITQIGVAARLAIDKTTGHTNFLGANFFFGANMAFGASAANVIGIYVGTAPTTSPANTGQLWQDPSGALKYRSPAGTVTTIGPA